MKVEYTFTLENIEATAKQILQDFNAYKIFALYGDMGAGKTTLTNAFCKALGVTQATGSPTYGIISEYNGFYNNNAVQICHMDWYRLADAEAAFNAGVVEYLQNTQIYCFIEWPSVAPSILPINTLHVRLQIVNFEERKLIIESREASK